MKLSKLFYITCNLIYKEKGQSVNYQLTQKENTLFIFFQPTNSTKDWFSNFAFLKKPYKDMKVKYKVHGGFLKCWKEAKDDIVAALREDSIKKIIISGYSHGAALAMLCHECCWFERPDIRDNIWTFGFEAPRVYGGWHIKKNIRMRWNHYIMIKNGSDIVTHLPPVLFGFRHVGAQLHVGIDRHFGPVDSHRPDCIYQAIEDVDLDIDCPELFKKLKTDDNIDIEHPWLDVKLG